MRDLNTFNVLSHELKAKTGHNGHSELLQETFHAEPSSSAFPYLEEVIVAAKKHPYAMLAAMISIASLVVAAVVTVSVALFTGVFLMYGTMRDIQAKQVTILEQQAETRGQISVIKTVHMTTLARQDIMVSLMSKESQQQIAVFDKANPRQVFPQPEKQ